ncbi:MAG TPA: glycosyltransferase family 39 protein [Flavobacteriales bacterium]
MLFKEEALELGHENWTQNHVWVHKPPFFLWLMALSLKILGTTVFAVRLPSIIAGTAMVYFTHGIANKLRPGSGNAAALLLACSHWLLGLVGGSVMTDHNDAIFLALVTGGFWAVLTLQGPSRVIVVGLFTGAAVLTKWLPGFVILFPWFVQCVLLDTARRPLAVRHFALAGTIALVIASAWYVHAWTSFPVEMAHENHQAALHWNEAVEGHTGDRYFYWKALGEVLRPFPSWIWALSLLALCLFIEDRGWRWSIILTVVLTFAFYTLASTKMTSYVMFTLPFFVIGLVQLVMALITLLPRSFDRRIVHVLAFGSAAVALLQFGRYRRTHGDQVSGEPFFEEYRSKHLHNMDLIARTKELLPTDGPVILFNIPFPANVEFSFFTGHEALPFVPNDELVRKLMAKGYKVLVIPSGTIPLPPHAEALNLPRDEAFVVPPL